MRNINFNVIFFFDQELNQNEDCEMLIKPDQRLLMNFLP